MKIKTTCFFIFLIQYAILCISCFRNDKKEPEFKEHEVKDNLIVFSSLNDLYPSIAGLDCQTYSYRGFDLCYDEEHEQASWVIYLFTREELHAVTERTNNFIEDKNIKSGSAMPSDYLYSGYDRGHLAPAGDMKWSLDAMNESFMMSNISPQVPGFNRGIWKKLEEKVRVWVNKNDSMCIVTGPVFKENKGIIGQNRVTVPGYYYKAIFDLSWPEYKSIAFLLRNEASDKSINDFAITLDSLEIFTGYDFFPLHQFEKYESDYKLSDWE